MSLLCVPIVYVMGDTIASNICACLMTLTYNNIVSLICDTIVPLTCDRIVSLICVLYDTIVSLDKLGIPPA